MSSKSFFNATSICRVRAPAVSWDATEVRDRRLRIGRLLARRLPTENEGSSMSTLRLVSAMPVSSKSRVRPGERGDGNVGDENDGSVEIPADEYSL